MNLKTFILSLFLISFTYAQDNIDLYFKNLIEIKKVKKINEDLPITFNQICQSGYFSMPSAKMTDAGIVGGGYTSSFPYQIFAVNLQYFDHLEFSANFWIYKNLLENNFGHMGYGNDADRAANIKVALNRRKDGIKLLPDIAIGINDFYGSKRFHSKYLVFTKQLIEKNLEITFGYGTGRINGFFSALAYFYPIKANKFLDYLCFFAEYDANNYKNHKYEHPKGRKTYFPINVGINFKFLKIFQGALCTLRGEKISGSIFAIYNLGNSTGLFPKYLDPPINNRYNNLNSNYNFTENLTEAFKKQGLDLTKITLYQLDKEKKGISLDIINMKYRSSKNLRSRIENILTFLPFNNYETIFVRIESEGLYLHEFKFKKKYLNAYKANNLGLYELEALCPLKEVSTFEKQTPSKVLYEKKNQVWMLTLRPKINAFFNGCRGKLKADSGMLLCLDGYINEKIYYNVQGSYIIKTSSAQVGSRDRYNPSQIINVRSDFVKYFESNTIHLDSAYLQKNWNLKRALFAKLSFGYFELAYGGVATELLYYPLDSNFAFSIEAANVYKRDYQGLGFQKTIRKWRNLDEIFEKFIGYQFFLNLFYEIKPLGLNFKTTIGQFLARDKGIKIEFSRFFKSGFELSTWITFTNARDVVNNKRYFDKGFSIIVPFDLFINKSSRKKITLKMSEWLRDVGAKASTGKDLYAITHDERYFP